MTSSYARELVQLLAQRLYLLDRACTGADAGGPADAFVEVRAPAVDHPEEDFALRLRDMYESWGRVEPPARDRRGLAELPASTTIVRRYRTGPSPLVRDSVHDWRAGRLDRVLAGVFDVIADS